MHELAVTQELIKLILEKSNCPKTVTVELGEMTTYKKEPIEYYFNILKKDNPSLASTELVVIEIPAIIFCPDCDAKSPLVEPFIECCPDCQSWNVKLVQGKDFILKSITE